MKPELQRIETALHQLGQASPTDSQKISSSVARPAYAVEEPTKGDPSFSVAVAPFPAQKHQGKTPTLPKLKSPTFSNHRHATNPALAMNLLKEIEAIVAGWQKELRTIVRQIQDIYMDGPIVDGWLESHSQEGQEVKTEVRQATVDRLMDYVAEALPQPDAKVTCESPRTGYRLCGLDANGQFWSRFCPSDQVPSVSLAIARHQKLRQLLSRKQDLETRLGQLAETLIVMHGHLSQD
jgi:hypothetical protein